MSDKPIRKCDVSVHVTSREVADRNDPTVRRIELVAYHQDDEEQPAILLTPSEAASLAGLLLAAAAAVPSMGPEADNMYGPIDCTQEYRTVPNPE
jgi:hypothetical protein